MGTLPHVLDHVANIHIWTLSLTAIIVDPVQLVNRVWLNSNME
jgi:hypothetical protein